MMLKNKIKILKNHQSTALKMKAHNYLHLLSLLTARINFK